MKKIYISLWRNQITTYSYSVLTRYNKIYQMHYVNIHKHFDFVY